MARFPGPLRIPRWDAFLAVGLAVGGQVELWTGLVDGPRPALAAAQLLGTLPVAWCRRFPTTALVTVWVVLVVEAALGADLSTTLFVSIAGLVTATAAGRYSRRPGVALGAALALALAAIIVDSGTERLEDIVFIGGLIAALWAAGRAIAVRQLREDLLQERAVQLTQETEWRAAAAVTEERARIARELHDLVAHSVSVMVLHAGGVRRALGEDREEERRALLTVEKVGREALDDMRRVVGFLRDGTEPPLHAPQPRMADAAELLDIARATGLAAELRVVGTPRPLPMGIDASAYRILQEALTNVRKHADATHVTCTVRYDDRAVGIEVEDDGPRTRRRAPSFADGRTGHGLVGMRERVALYGGSLEAGHLPARGYRVVAVLPLRSEPL